MFISVRNEAPSSRRRRETRCFNASIAAQGQSTGRRAQGSASPSFDASQRRIKAVHG